MYSVDPRMGSNHSLGAGMLFVLVPAGDAWRPCFSSIYATIVRHYYM